MRIVGWPEEHDADGGILPVTISDVDFHATPAELRLVARFLLKAASELDYALANNSELTVGVELENANPATGVGLWINVVRSVDE